MSVRRGTSNGNQRGNVEGRRRRREWLVATFRADVDALVLPEGLPPVMILFGVPLGQGHPACRCYRCGVLLTVETVSADRIIPGCQGGTYRRDNIRPACETCNSITGGATRRRGATVPKIEFGRNKSRQVAGRGGAVGGVKPAERKDAPCDTCGANPGHSCYTLASVKQVAAGKEGAYLKTQKTLHTGRGVVPGDLRPGKR